MGKVYDGMDMVHTESLEIELEMGLFPHCTFAPPLSAEHHVHSWQSVGNWQPKWITEYIIVSFLVEEQGRT
jgi:hypothetical protein